MRLSESEYAALRRRMGKPAKQQTALPPRSELQEQQIVIRWAGMVACQYPALAFLHHSPNGFARDKAVAVQIRAAGCRPGFPDLFLPVPAGGFHGLFVELKTAAGRLSPQQETWLTHLRREGYAACVAVGADEAIRVIEAYLRGEYQP